MKRLAFAFSAAALTGVCVISRWCSEQETAIRRLRADLLAQQQHNAVYREALAIMKDRDKMPGRSLVNADAVISSLPGERFTNLWPTPEDVRRFVQTPPLDPR